MLIFPKKILQFKGFKYESYSLLIGLGWEASFWTADYLFLQKYSYIRSSLHHAEHAIIPQYIFPHSLEVPGTL